jgi:hypothetical protein
VRVQFRPILLQQVMDEKFLPLCYVIGIRSPSDSSFAASGAVMLLARSCCTSHFASRAFARSAPWCMSSFMVSWPGTRVSVAGLRQDKKPTDMKTIASQT